MPNGLSLALAVKRSGQDLRSNPRLSSAQAFQEACSATAAVSAFSWSIGEDIFKKSVSAGTWTFPELELQEGQNSVSITGEGTTTFRYREGRL